MIETLHLSEHFPVGCVSTDRHGVIKEVNRAAMTMLGQQRESRVLGMPLIHWVKKGHRRAYLSHLGRVRRGDRSCVDVDLATAGGRHLSVNLTSMLQNTGIGEKDGVILNALIEVPDEQRQKKDQLQHAKHELEEQRQVAHREVSELQVEMRERDYYEERLQQAQGRSSFMAEAAGALLRSSHYREVIERLCHRLFSLAVFDVFLHHLVDDATGRLKLVTSGGITERMRDRLSWINLGENITGYVALENEPVVVEHLQQSRDIRVKLLQVEGLRAYVCLPLMGNNDQAIGSISFGSRVSDTIDRDDLDLAAALAEYAASALRRQQNEDDLRRSEARYHSLFRNMSEGFALHEIIRNAKSEPVDLVVTDINPAFERLTGYTARQYNGQRVSMLTPESDRAFFDAMLKVAATSEPLQEEIYNAHMNRWFKSLIYRPTENRIAAVLVDVTALREAERREMEALAQAASTRAAREVLDALDEGVVLMDLEGRINSVNRAFEELAGSAGNMLEGQFLEDALKQMKLEGGEQLLLAIACCIQGKAIDLDAYPLERKAGDTTFTYLPALSFVRDPAGSVAGAVMSLRDVTALKRMNEERDRYQRHLRLMSERLANTEDRTRHRISVHIHDTIIQTLSLAAIKIGSLRVDLEEGQLENAHHELGTLRTLVTESITESRALMAELSPPLLNELGLVAGLEDLADRLTTLYKVPVEVRNDELDITLDKSIERNLFRCTRELIMNALKHARANVIHVDVWHRDGALVIRVADDGVGFEVPGGCSFVTGPEGGFGLFSVVESLKNHHGALTMDSSPGGGVTAEIMLPLRKKRKQAAA